jgi:hypothetical protein
MTATAEARNSRDRDELGVKACTARATVLNPLLVRPLRINLVQLLFLGQLILLLEFLAR